MAIGRAVLGLVLLSLIASCSTLERVGLAVPGGEPAATPTASIALAPGKSAIVGRVFSTAGSRRQPLGDTIVVLGVVHWNQQKTDGAFVFEGASSPRASTGSDGSFAFVDIAPADYVILAGDLLGRYEILSMPDGKARVFTAQAGKPLDIGSVEVKLAPPPR